MKRILAVCACFGLLGGVMAFAAPTGLAEQHNLDEYERMSGNMISSFQESPLLAARVASGDLPPVDDRLPTDVAVVVPVEGIGQYGGTAYAMALAMVGIGEGYSLKGTEGLFTVAADLKTLIPNVVKSHVFAPDGKSLTVTLRSGMKWSDGAPFSADDMMFWYEDLLTNEEVTSRINNRLMPGGEVMKWTKVDDHTIRMDFSVPFQPVLSYMSLLDGNMFAPAHYLKQFHADYADKGKLDAMVKDGGFDTWTQLLADQRQRASSRNPYINPDMPSLDSFITKQVATGTTLYERNPFYWKVDPAGNQLPYIDQIQVSSVENTELLTAKMLAGEADWHGEGSDLSNYSVYQEGAQGGNYRVLLWDQDGSSDAAYFPNLTPKDPAIASINHDKRFRIALSLAINRESINKTLFFGRGVVGQPTALPGAPWFDESFRDAYAEQDVAEANRLLDEMGMKWDANNEWRMRPDGNPFEYLVISGPVGLSNKVTELVIEDWKAIGIKVNFKVQDWGITHPLHQSGESHMFALFVDKSDAFGLTSGGNGLSWYAFTDGARYFDTPLLPPANSGGEWPPEFSPDEYPFTEIVRLQELAGELQQTFDEGRRTEILREVFRSQAENLWIIGTVVGKKPILVSNRLGNHPEVGVWGDGLKQMTAFHPEQLYLKQ